jgi:protein-L-isoaspartate(D-aspartate) O-methyltransferase
LTAWDPGPEEAEALRTRMVDRLVGSGVVTTPEVEQVLRLVPRHLFLSGVPLADAYRDEAVLVKRAAGGSPISSASQPTMVASMLEALDVRPGQRVLEIGTGTGYNAGLLAELAGPHGRVVSVELEGDLAGRAAETIARAVAHPVEVVAGDGALGYPPAAPYQRVVVTAGASRVLPTWEEQLAEGGRLVVPIVDAAGVGSVVVFDKVGGRLVAGADIPCAFLPLRYAPGA